VPALIREEIAQFIEGEGHRVEVSLLEETEELAEIAFRTRGQMFSIAVSEVDPTRFSISTAYEVPEWLSERAGGAGDSLRDVEHEYPGTRFMLAHDGTIFVATIDFEAPNVGEFTGQFWRVLGRLRDAGNSAVERMVDRSESKAAADKFIRQFMRGDR